MERFRRILVYAGQISGPDPALERACGLATSNGAALKLVHVVEAVSGYYLKGFLPAQWDIRDLIEKETQRRLEKRVEPLRRQGIDATAEVLFGRPALEVTREVLRNGHDLVMKTALGEDSLLGTAATRLMRVCPCPVWVVARGAPKRFRRILAAVDPEPDEDEQEALNLAILDLASSLSTCEGADLHVLHAWRNAYDYGWSVHGEDLFGGGLSEAELFEYLDSARLDAAERVGALLSRSGISLPEKNVHLSRGSPEAVIPLFIRENAIDLIVMGTIARSGIKGFFIGSTAERVLRKVDCSVLAVKPDRFASPVTLEAVPPLTPRMA